MASPGNQHCADCNGTVSFRIGGYCAIMRGAAKPPILGQRRRAEARGPKRRERGWGSWEESNQPGTVRGI